MIILFHTIHFLIKLSYNFLTVFKSNTKGVDSPPFNDSEESLRFYPPVYRQRYLAVKSILEEHESLPNQNMKVVDFGCAELSFFVFLKNSMRVGHVLEVDIDNTLLNENIFRVKPLTTDFLTLKTFPLTVEILCGSIGDPDYRLADVDAVIAIEVIEHLYPDTVEALSYNIFGYIHPKVAIFTTPNADFNVLFPNFTGFRHDDHKFEWTREQFQDWALNQTMRFPEYSVVFEGIGEAPKSKDLGHCSQMAVFTRKYKGKYPKAKSYGICTYYSYSKNNDENSNNEYYNLVDMIEYPYNNDSRTAAEKLLDELICFFNQNCSTYSMFYNEQTDCVEIPFSVIKARFSALEDVEKLILDRTDFILRECGVEGQSTQELFAVYDLNLQSDLSDDVIDSEDYAGTRGSPATDSELDWD